MASAWHSFLDVVAPNQRQSQLEGLGQHPHTHQLVHSQASESCSRSNSKGHGVSGGPDTTQRQPEVLVREEHSDSESEEEFQDSRSTLAPGDLEDLTPAPGIFPSSSQTGMPGMLPTSVGDPVSSGNLDVELVIGQEYLNEDAKFYQDAAINYQNAYKALFAQQAELQNKFEAQSHLIQQTSAAINVAESEAKIQHQELLHIR